MNIRYFDLLCNLNWKSTSHLGYCSNYVFKCTLHCFRLIIIMHCYILIVHTLEIFMFSCLKCLKTFLCFLVLAVNLLNTRKSKNLTGFN